MEEQEIQQSITAAFHSVVLINEVITGVDMQNEPLAEKVQRIDANVGHLNVMLSKDWFDGALTAEQRADIDLAITSGSSYVQANSN